MSSLFVLGTLLVIGHLFTASGEVKEVGWLHYWTHVLYARLEPLVIRAADFMVSRKFFTANRWGRGLLWLTGKLNLLLPHGVVIPTSAAIRIVRDVEKHGGGGHIAVGSCVCQRNLNRYREPTIKDMTLWYGAEIYLDHFGDDYRLISAEEAVTMLKDFHRLGLTPVAEFLMQSRRWFFVLCNCDAEVCCPTRIYNAVGCSLYPGPFRAVQDPARCLGPAECGACLSRCHFGANRVEDGKVVLEPARCLGCGLCVTTCRGKARRLEPRPGYRGRLLPWEYERDDARDEAQGGEK